MTEKVTDQRLQVILEHLKVMPDGTKKFNCTRFLVKDLRSICTELQEFRERQVK